MWVKVNMQLIAGPFFSNGRPYEFGLLIQVFMIMIIWLLQEILLSSYDLNLIYRISLLIWHVGKIQLQGNLHEEKKYINK